MTPLTELSLEVTRWLQATYPQLESFLQALTLTGDFEFYLAVMPILYWCVDKRFAKHLVYLVLISYVINAGLKHTLRTPRPFWLDPEVGLADASSYGVPSGHTQTATVVYLYIAGWFRKSWVWVLAMVMVFLMALSRVYLGVHALLDVAIGFLIGVVLLGTYAVWMRIGYEGFRNRILGQRLLPVIILPVILALAYVVARLIIGPVDTDVIWADFVLVAETDALDELVTSVALLFGAGVGLILEAGWVHFLPGGPLWKRAARYVLGMAVAIALWQGLGVLFPDDPLWLGIPLRFLRYGLLGLWIAYWAPALFVRVGLAEAAEGPEVSISVNKESIMKG
jgi:membrane-associated phospholipid phosphatase